MHQECAEALPYKDIRASYIIHKSYNANSHLNKSANDILLLLFWGIRYICDDYEDLHRNVVLEKVNSASTGLVTGVKNGSATIIVKTANGGYKATCTIKVGLSVKGVKINTTAKMIGTGKVFQLAAWPQPSNAVNKKVTWNSSNEDVAMVNSVGTVVGLSKGASIITVKTVDGNYTASCKIYVTASETGRAEGVLWSITPGQSTSFPDELYPGNTLRSERILSSSDDSIAMVSDDSGRIVGVKEGHAVITLKTKDGGYTATCRVYVGQRAEGIKISTYSHKMRPGCRHRL